MASEDILLKLYTIIGKAPPVEDEASVAVVRGLRGRQKIVLSSYRHDKPITALRFDPSEMPVSFVLEGLTIVSETGEPVYAWQAGSNISAVHMHDIAIRYGEETLLECLSDDAWMVFDLAQAKVGQQLTLHLDISQIEFPSTQSRPERLAAREIHEDLVRLLNEQEDHYRKWAMREMRQDHRFKALEAHVADLTDGLRKIFDNMEGLASSHYQDERFQNLADDIQEFQNGMQKHAAETAENMRDLSESFASGYGQFEERMTRNLRMLTEEGEQRQSALLLESFKNVHSQSTELVQRHTAGLSESLIEIMARSVQTLDQGGASRAAGLKGLVLTQSRQIAESQSELMRDVELAFERLEAGLMAGMTAIKGSVDAGSRPLVTAMAREMSGLQASLQQLANDHQGRQAQVSQDVSQIVGRLHGVEAELSTMSQYQQKLAGQLAEMQDALVLRGRQQDADFDEIVQNFAFVNRKANRFPTRTAARVLAHHYRGGTSINIDRGATDMAEAEALIRDLKAELVETRAFVEVILGSRSWFLTKPVRFVMRFFSRMVKLGK